MFEGYRVISDRFMQEWEKVMKGQRVGYVRVSSEDQNPERQLDTVPVDRLFIDKASAKDIHRPQLTEALAFLREGDTFIIHSMDRLARNLGDLRQLVTLLTQKGVQVEFIKEKLLFSGQDSPIAILMLSVMGAFAEFERSLLKERQREGIELAKKRGVYRGRKRALSEHQLEEITQRVAKGERKSDIARSFNISRETLYHYLRQESTEKKNMEVPSN